MIRIKLLNKQRYMALLVSLFLTVGVGLYAQVTVTGVITSSTDKLPIPGVNVTIKGTTIGTISDVEGNYTIEAPSKTDILVFSMMGMLSQEVQVGENTNYNLEMSEDLVGLEEVIVVGYGTMKKSDVAGSIVSVGGEELNEVKSPNILAALQGKVAGLDISPSSGQAGSGVSMQLRGERSMSASGDPLIIVDGIPQSAMTSMLNPNDIESVEVLKDAASTAIYGAKGANGIILITTKRGKEGASKVYYNGYHSFTTPYQKLPVYDRDGYIKAKMDAYRNYTNDSLFLINPDTSKVFLANELQGLYDGSETDWQDQVTRNGYITSHQVGVSGGSTKTTYNTAIDYFEQKGVVVEDAFKRFTGKVDLSVNVSDKLSVGTSTTVSQRIKDGDGINFTDAFRLSPMVESHDTAGNKIMQPAAPNPRQNALMYEDDTYEERRTNLFTNMFVNYQLLPSLTLRSNFGYSVEAERIGYTYPNEDPIRSGDERYTKNSYTWSNIITFDKTMGIHHLIFTAVHEMQESRREWFITNTYNQQYESSLWYNYSTSDPDTRGTQSGLTEQALVSFVGRANYTLSNKYVFNATVRSDGASQLYPGSKWDYFPAVGVAWRLSQEEFMAGISNVLNDLKLRFGYGTVGNYSISEYGTFGGLSPSPYYYEFGGYNAESATSIFRPERLGVADLHWEKTQQINLGIDFSLFTSRISGSVDLYKAYTSSILLPDTPPSSSGYSAPVYTNAGKTESRGIEVMLKAYVISQDDFTWRVNVSGDFVDEKITELSSGVTQDVGNGWFVGEPVNVRYDYEKIGIWQYDDVENAPTTLEAYPGGIKVRDVNGDSVISQLEDRVVLGQENPNLRISFENTFTYKNFTFSFGIIGKFGHLLDASAYDFDSRMYNNQIDINYWTPLNQTNDYPRLDYGRAETPYASTLQYKDGGFIKLKNVSLGYTIPAAALEKIKISSLNVYINSQNTAVLFSHLDKGLDPERGGRITWPLARTITVGVNVEF